MKSFPSSQWDGRWSLQELSAFARHHGQDEKQLLRALAAAAGVEIASSHKPPQGPSPLVLIFTAIAICLTLGGSWGVLLLLRIALGGDYLAVSGASIHVHGLAELWGWMALFIFAVGSHLLRQNTRLPASPWLERAAAGLILISISALFVALILQKQPIAGHINITASAALALAALLFGISVVRSSVGQSRSQRIRGWPWMIAWLWAWAGTDLWQRLHYTNLPVLPDNARQLMIVLAVLGFATNAIYGFGVRLIPGFLNITCLRPRFFTAALLLHNLGLCLFLMGDSVIRTVGVGLMLVGSAAYLIGMNGLRGKAARHIYGVDVRGHILIRAAFAWLVAGLTMIFIEQLIPGLPHAYAGAWRHALTVGFITTMILGVGQRLVPVFIKQPLASAKLMLIGATLIIVGCAGRVGLELATMTKRPWTFQWMGLTGVLELTALALFAWNLALTVRRRRHIYTAAEPLRPDTRAREAINARPELQQRLNSAGITMFDEAGFIAPSMAMGALAFASGRQPAELLADLGEESKSAAMIESAI